MRRKIERILKIQGETVMKILVVCQHYYPEPFRITDICEEWVKRGHEVTVVAGLPNYPEGKIYNGYKGKAGTEEMICGVRVHRCFEIARRSGIVFRLLNYYSFAWSSKRYIKKMKEKFDVVFANQLSPIMMVNGAVAYKKKHGTKLVMYSLDLWPESLVVGGIRRGSLVYKYFHRLSKKIYSQADKLLFSSKQFREYFKKEFQIEDAKMEYLPQYAETLFAVDSCRKEQSETIDLLFAGNIGAAQSVETIIRAAAETQDIENLRWHIVGEGSSLSACQALAMELNVKSVTFYGRKPLEEMPAFYKKADAMLVTLMDDDVLSLTLPGKVQTYMAAGKPIIAASNGEIATILQDSKCGFCVSAENYIELAQKVREFCQLSEEKRADLGKKAREFYEDNFDKETFFKKVEELFV